MSVQSDIDALTARLNAVVAAINALPAPGVDATALTTAVTAVEAAVAAKATPPA